LETFSHDKKKNGLALAYFLPDEYPPHIMVIAIAVHKIIVSTFKAPILLK